MPVTTNPINVVRKLNNSDISFQVDSGASISTISEYDAHRVYANIKPSSRQVLAYNGECVPLIGEANVRVSHHNVSMMHTFFIVSNNKVNLLGRDLCSKLDVKLLFPNSLNCVNEILAEFREYLSDSYVSNVSQNVHLDVSQNARPIYLKSRSVPVKLRDKLNAELQRLVNEGKLTKVFNAKWASPIVTVFK